MAYEPKTVPTSADVTAFLDAVDNEVRRRDAFVLLKMLGEITNEPAEMWGPAIVGFGRFRYINGSGKEQEVALIGFSPRKQATTLYFVNRFETYDELLTRLGKHKVGKGCLYINDLADIDMDVFTEILRSAAADRRATSLPLDA